jgi:hypothetical protein
MVMKSSIFWDIPPCRPLKVNRRFGGTFLFHLHGGRIRQTRNRHEVGSKQSFTWKWVLSRLWSCLFGIFTRCCTWNLSRR